jgi:Ca2+/H+ antiporter, TMEM165/GDT1 family
MIVHAPLTRVPENTLKFGVGIMLTSFGIFWSTEGAGIKWPGADASILGVIAFVIVTSFGIVALARRAMQIPEVATS